MYTQGHIAKNGFYFVITIEMSNVHSLFIVYFYDRIYGRH